MSNSTSYDVIVLGAGAAGMSAACVAASEGLSTLLIESSPLVGGTTAVSGGMLWVPGNDKLPAERQQEDREYARRYLQHVLPQTRDDALLEAYLLRAAEAMAYLEARTAVALRPVAFYPDYYPEIPGAALGVRVLEPAAFDARELGADFPLLRPPLPEFTLFGGMMVDRADLPHLRNVLNSPASAWRVARIVARHARDRLSFARGAHLVLGNALAARLLKSVRAAGASLRLQTRVKALLRENGRVAGVIIDNEEKIAASHVILATGGFSHDQELRRAHLPLQAGERSAASATARGEGLRLGIEAGGAVGADNTNNAYWVPVSCFVRADGSTGVFPHTVTDRGKPGVIAVDRRGERFVNEAQSYHEFVQAMFRSDAIPAWLICDRRALWKYGLGAVRPFTYALARPTRSGYLHRAADLRTLALATGIDADGLVRAVERYNRDARDGVDRAFGKGANAYHKYVGDSAHRPNPCMAPLEHPPYYAVALYPGDLGTAAGLRVNAHAQVLDETGNPVGGLYACGNDMRSIMHGAYPGAGITLGPALTFGYLAAMHIARGAA